MLKLNLKSTLLLTALAVSATRVAHSVEDEKNPLASSTGINRLQDVDAIVSPLKDRIIPDDKTINLPKLKTAEFFIASRKAENPTLKDLFLTKASNFQLDDHFNAVTYRGQYLKYFPYDLTTGTFPVGCNTATIEDTATLNLAGFSGMPQATDHITIEAALPGNAFIGDTRTHSIRVYDNLGGSHILNLTWTKTAVAAPGQTWNLALETRDGKIQGAFNHWVDIKFDGNGLPIDFAGGDVMPAIKINWNNEASDSLINLDLGTAGASNGVTAGGGKNFDLNSIIWNGYPAGRLKDVDIAKNGEVSITFETGAAALKIGRVPVATFTNTHALLTEEADTSLLKAEKDSIIPLSKISDYSLKFIGDDK